MVWVTSERTRLEIVAAATMKHGPLADWWLDDAVLAAYWQAMDWPYMLGRDGAACAVKVADGVVAWLRCAIDTGEPAFVLYAIAPDDGRVVVPFAQFHAGRFPADWVTRHTARKSIPTIKQPALAGDWVGCRDMHTGEGVLGRCVAVGERGEVLRVQLADGGPVVAADQLSLRWFRINERDEACAQAWRSGHTSWPVYIHMLSALARMQRAAIGKAAFKTQQDKRKADRPKPAKTKEAGKLDQVKVALMAGYTAMIRAGVPREEAQAWLDEEHAKLPGIC